MRIWHLSLSSFAGIVSGASHYHVCLCSPDRSTPDVYMSREMTTKEIRDENRASWKQGFGAPFRQGAETNSFSSEESAIQAGVEYFKSQSGATSDDLLLLGNSCVTSPQRPLVGPTTLLSRLSKIWEEFDRIDGWDGGENKRADELDKEWSQALEGAEE